MRVDPTWRPLDVPGTLAAWVAPEPWHGFTANANLVHVPGASPRGDALVEHVVLPLLDELEDRMLVDVALGAPDDLRLVVSHRVGAHRVSLLQRILVDDRGSVTLSLTVPDLQLATLREAWTTPLRSFDREASR